MCKLFGNGKLKACEAEKAEALQSLAELMDRYSQLETTYGQLLTSYSQCQTELAAAQVKPKIEPCGTIDIHTMSSILLDKLEDMEDNYAAIYLPDRDNKVYRKADVVEFLHLDETDQIVWKAEVEDCDDIAAQVFDDGLSLVWTNVHALNYFVDENETFWFVEPQTDKIARNLENWQGWDVRFFLGR